MDADQMIRQRAIEMVFDWSKEQGFSLGEGMLFDYATNIANFIKSGSVPENPDAEDDDLSGED